MDGSPFLLAPVFRWREGAEAARRDEAIRLSRERIRQRNDFAGAFDE
jgi:hypothetical protein